LVNSEIDETPVATEVLNTVAKAAFDAGVASEYERVMRIVSEGKWAGNSLVEDIANLAILLKPVA